MIEMTQEGKQKLEQELEYLKTVLMAQISEEIKEARAHGDLSENAEYDAAMNKQAETDGRIQELERVLRDVIIIDENAINTKVVNIGTTVRIKNTATKEEFEYQIVSSAEANLAGGKISNESPVGSALINHKSGDVVEVVAPVGTVTFKIVKIMK